MAQIDFSYLDRFAGEKVKVTSQVNPAYHRGQTVTERLGRLAPENKWASVRLFDKAHVPEHDKGQLVKKHIGEGVIMAQWSTLPNRGSSNTPYLGIETCLWRIEKLEDGLVLFDHELVSGNLYNLLNHEKRVLGQIELALPYNPPYDCYEATSSRGKDPMADFLSWRDNLVRLL
jgi:hypothetical protein